MLGLFALPNVHPEYQNSPLSHMLLGAITSAGGGLAAGTFSLWSPNWTISTPPPLRVGAGWAGTLDLWGGALVGQCRLFIHFHFSNDALKPCLALIYSSTTHHPAFTSLHTYTTLILSSHLLSGTRKPHADSDFPPLSSLEAKSLAGAVLGLLFAARVIKQHWLTAPVAQQMTSKPTAATSPSKKIKKKTQ